MKIAGFQPQSFVDYPGMIVSTIFTQGCNLNCWYCHNYKTIPMEADNLLDTNNILTTLYQRQHLIDGICITGGEPLLQIDLFAFISAIKKEIPHFKIKLDTNGTIPDNLELGIKSNMFDYVAMDIKYPYYKYFPGYDNLENIKKSIYLICSSKLEHEFRTTFTPNLIFEDIEYIKKHMIYNDPNYYLQQYRQVRESDPLPHSDEYLSAIADKLNCKTRGITGD